VRFVGLIGEGVLLVYMVVKTPLCWMTPRYMYCSGARRPTMVV
jgi:hypothetical protein